MAVKLPENNRHWTTNWEFRVSDKPPTTNVYAGHGDFSGTTIELKNSMMSHQSYRNYTTFMEAELALLQDLGYDIDRRNFFGRSVYGDGLTLFNDSGYFQRDPSGSRYLPGTYNEAGLGLGLQVYGSRNTIYQRADLLTRGPGGMGIRIDGQENTLTIDPGVRVHADGPGGCGLAVAYGRDHNIVQRGDGQVMGEHGIGASFDFGNNMIGNSEGYRGSYIYYATSDKGVQDIAGPLVASYDLTGRVAGRKAAIYMSGNALVENINVMRGALIEGDIVSHYEQRDQNNELRLTRLGFGRPADDQGRSTGLPDATFALRHDGNIRGANLALAIDGGHTSLNGRHQLDSVHIAPGATLAGDSHCTVSPRLGFVNDGILAPGNSLGRIDIDGDYRQGHRATLAIEVDGSGTHDVLAVRGHSILDGELAITALPDWYGNDWKLSFDQMLQSGTVSGGFAAVTISRVSPCAR